MSNEKRPPNSAGTSKIVPGDFIKNEEPTLDRKVSLNELKNLNTASRDTVSIQLSEPLDPSYRWDEDTLITDSRINNTLIQTGTNVTLPTAELGHAIVAANQTTRRPKRLALYFSALVLGILLSLAFLLQSPPDDFAREPEVAPPAPMAALEEQVQQEESTEVTEPMKADQLEVAAVAPAEVLVLPESQEVSNVNTKSTLKADIAGYVNEIKTAQGQQPEFDYARGSARNYGATLSLPESATLKSEPQPTTALTQLKKTGKNGEFINGRTGEKWQSGWKLDDAAGNLDKAKAFENSNRANSGTASGLRTLESPKQNITSAVVQPAPAPKLAK